MGQIHTISLVEVGLRSWHTTAHSQRTCPQHFYTQTSVRPAVQALTSNPHSSMLLGDIFEGKLGHSYIGHNYEDHDYIGYDYIGNDYTVHNYMGPYLYRP